MTPSQESLSHDKHYDTAELSLSFTDNNGRGTGSLWSLVKKTGWEVEGGAKIIFKGVC